MKIAAVDRRSPLFGRVRSGCLVVSVNGKPVRDEIDFRYRTVGEQVEIVIAEPGGEKQVFCFKAGEADQLGLSFDDREIKTCVCNCIFCFVHQQPKGMRRALYVRDEDYRLSFTHGNFITLSNVTEADLKRIITQRLSPLYVSVHTVDDKLRRRMLRRKKLSPILPRLKQLTQHGIELHTQVVLCPGINDGDSLDETISRLADMYPGVKSLAVVPVGLTKYRERLPKLRTYTTDEAERIIDRIEYHQGCLLGCLGSRFVWVADELYVRADREFPVRSAYEDLPQFENGVGMAREFITGFNRRRARLGGLTSSKQALFLTGESSYRFFGRRLVPYLREKLGLRVELRAVPNRFWGDTVTASGLLTGQDLLRAARDFGRQCDVVVLPPNCLNPDNLFLDNLPLDRFRQTLEKEVVIGRYDLAATVREVFR